MSRWAPLLAVMLTTAAAAQDLCTVPEETQADIRPLGRVQAALAQRQPLVILAIGGASTAGGAAGAPEAAYPARLAALLRERHPGLATEVVNAGRPRESTRAMAERMTGLLIAHRPQLVIWETGTADAVRRIDPGDFEQALQGGIAIARARGADILLMDFQFGRGPSALIDFQPYIERLYWVADMTNVTVFRRYDMMRFWSDDGRLDLAETQGDRQRKMAATLYDCIARRLVDVIGQATR
jgi:acyl-CoA thioesterase-1